MDGAHPNLEVFALAGGGLVHIAEPQQSIVTDELAVGELVADVFAGFERAISFVPMPAEFLVPYVASDQCVGQLQAVAFAPKPIQRLDGFFGVAAHDGPDDVHGGEFQFAIG